MSTDNIKYEWFVVVPNLCVCVFFFFNLFLFSTLCLFVWYQLCASGFHNYTAFNLYFFSVILSLCCSLSFYFPIFNRAMWNILHWTLHTHTRFNHIALLESNHISFELQFRLCKPEHTFFLFHFFFCVSFSLLLNFILSFMIISTISYTFTTKLLFICRSICWFENVKKPF